MNNENEMSILDLIGDLNNSGIDARSIFGGAFGGASLFSLNPTDDPIIGGGPSTNNGTDTDINF